MEGFTKTILVIAILGLIAWILIWFWENGECYLGNGRKKSGNTRNNKKGKRNDMKKEENKEKNIEEPRTEGPVKSGEPVKNGESVNVPMTGQDSKGGEEKKHIPKPESPKKKTIITVEYWCLNMFDEKTGETRSFPFELTKGKTVKIGRDKCEITLPDPSETLSRKHASVSLEDEGLVLRDLDSTNGCKTADGKKQTVIRVKDGQVVYLGSLKVSFTRKSVQQL